MTEAEVTAKAPDNLSDYLEILIADRLERRILDRENKRFRSLYIIFAVVTAIGFSVFLNQISISADSAVDKRVSDIIKRTETYRDYTNLMMLGTQLDIKNSFTSQQRDSATRLAIDLYSTKEISSDEGYNSIVENIIDALSASDNVVQILEICKGVGSLCSTNDGIAASVVSTFGKKILVSNEKTLQNSGYWEIFNASMLSALSQGSNKGMANAIMCLVDFKEKAPRSQIQARIRSVAESEPEVKEQFLKVLGILSDRHRISSAETPTPDVVLIENVGKAFLNSFQNELNFAQNKT